jgi:hypothetical protein
VEGDVRDLIEGNIPVIRTGDNVSWSLQTTGKTLLLFTEQSRESTRTNDKRQDLEKFALKFYPNQSRGLRARSSLRGSCLQQLITASCKPTHHITS